MSSSPFAEPRIEAEQRPDGRSLLRSAESLGEHPVSVVHSFRAHGEAQPDRRRTSDLRGLTGLLGLDEGAHGGEPLGQLAPGVLHRDGGLAYCLADVTGPPASAVVSPRSI